jgi:hypothetical protein
VCGTIKISRADEQMVLYKSFRCNQWSVSLRLLFGLRAVLLQPTVVELVVTRLPLFNGDGVTHMILADPVYLQEAKGNAFSTQAEFLDDSMTGHVAGNNANFDPVQPERLKGVREDADNGFGRIGPTRPTFVDPIADAGTLLGPSGDVIEVAFADKASLKKDPETAGCSETSFAIALFAPSVEHSTLFDRVGGVWRTEGFPGQQPIGTAASHFLPSQKVRRTQRPKRQSCRIDLRSHGGRNEAIGEREPPPWRGHMKHRSDWTERALPGSRVDNKLVRSDWTERALPGSRVDNKLVRSDWTERALLGSRVDNKWCVATGRNGRCLGLVSITNGA